MALVILLSAAAIAGIVYGAVKKNKKVLVVSIFALVVIAILLVVYSYLYAQNPY